MHQLCAHQHGTEEKTRVLHRDATAVPSLAVKAGCTSGRQRKCLHGWETWWETKNISRLIVQINKYNEDSERIFTVEKVLTAGKNPEVLHLNWRNWHELIIFKYMFTDWYRNSYRFKCGLIHAYVGSVLTHFLTLFAEMSEDQRHPPRYWLLKTIFY